MSETIAVNCNSCGASLEVEQSTRFVTCMHCGTRLEVRRNESSIFTQIIDRIEQNTTQAARDIEIIRLEQELERLDREWQMKHPNQPVGKSQSNPPTGIGGAIVGIVFLVIWVIVCFGMAASIPSEGFGAPPAFFRLVPILMGLFGIVGVGYGIFKAMNGESGIPNDEQFYQQRRSELVNQIETKRR